MRYDISVPQDRRVHMEDAAGLRGDVVVQDLLTKRPAELDAWVDSNVANIAGTKMALKILFRICIALLRKD